MRILTLSHVDAAWIKQRPHFVAEALAAQGNDVLFAYARAFSRNKLVNTEISCKTMPLVVAPNRIRKQGAVRLIDGTLQSLIGLVLAVAYRPEVVWLCSPRLELVARLVRRLVGAELVYDYMDRNDAFDDAHERVADAERRLFRLADRVTCSSAVLLTDVDGQAPHQKVQLMRNALSDPDRWSFRPGSVSSRPGHVVLGYAGTISSWLDVDLLAEALRLRPQWSIRLWGPADIQVPEHERMTVEGVLNHADLPDALHQCDVLVMPFRMTPLIEAVDPVKAYEYVATGRGVVLPAYSETDHFEPYADRYDAGDVESFVRAVESAAGRPVPQAVSSFVEQNTWDARVRELRLAGRR